MQKMVLLKFVSFLFSLNITKKAACLASFVFSGCPF